MKRLPFHLLLLSGLLPAFVLLPIVADRLPDLFDAPENSLRWYSTVIGPLLGVLGFVALLLLFLPKPSRTSINLLLLCGLAGTALFFAGNGGLPSLGALIRWEWRTAILLLWPNAVFLFCLLRGFRAPSHPAVQPMTVPS